MRKMILPTLILGLAIPAAAHAASPVRLIEAVAGPGWNPASVVRIVPASPSIAADRDFPALAASLADSLTQAGLHVDATAAAPDAYVVLGYETIRYWYSYGVNDPSYRAVLVTAITPPVAGAASRPNVLWRTAFEQTGILTETRAIIPPMLKTAERWYGRNLTPVKLGPTGFDGARLPY